MTRPNARLFPRWSLLLLCTFGVGSLIVSVALALWSDPRDIVSSYEADTFSESSLGHKGLAGLLREQGYAVRISRYETAPRARHAALTMLIEPRLSHEAVDGRAELEAQLKAARAALLVLPKRGGSPAYYPEGHIERVTEVGLSDVSGLLDAAELGWIAASRHDVPSEEARWRCDTALAAPCAPALYDLQVIAPDSRLAPIIASDEGLLVAEVVPAPQPGQRLFVLADPDLLANHGLHRGDNAALMLALVAQMAGAGRGEVLIDEILHGYLQRPTLIRELMRFPLVLLSVQFLLLALLVLWAAIKRFGPPAPEQGQTVADKVFSIKNTAELVHVGNHTAHMTQRYLSMTAEQVGQRLGAPPGLDEAGRIAWLAELTRARGVRHDVAAIFARAAQLGAQRRARARDWLDVARQIWSWRRAMLEAPGDVYGA